MSGLPCLSSFGALTSKRKRQRIMPLRSSNTAIAYTKSASVALRLPTLKPFVWQCRCLSRSSKSWPCQLKPRAGQFFPIHSWVDLRHVCDTSTCLAFHFRDYQTFFCLPPTSFIFPLKIFLIPGTFHPRRWSLAFPY